MESEELNKLVLDKMTKVCLCKCISRATIKKAIADGADTVGAGSGSCHGKRCTPKIEELLQQHENR